MIKSKKFLNSMLLAVIIIGSILGFYRLMRKPKESNEPQGSYEPRESHKPQESQKPQDSQDDSFDLPDSEPISVVGKITCLPKRTPGAQTLECALGLKTEDNLYYTLRNLSEFDSDYSLSQAESEIEVVGTLAREEALGPDGNPYDIVGIITIDSVHKL